MKVLITGAAGLYGVHLVNFLVRSKEISTVIGVDNFSREYLEADPFIKSDNFKEKFTLVKKNYQEISLEEFDAYDLDAIIHLAAHVSISESMDSPEAYFINNEYGTFKLIQTLCKTRNRPLMIYASSPEVYGNPIYLPMDVNHPTDPRSIYAVTKLAAEKHLKVMSLWYRYPLVTIRNFNTYGSNQNLWAHSAVIPEFIKRALLGQPLEIHGDGTQTRDFTYVEDAVLAYKLVLMKNKLLRGMTFNIGTGKQISINELAELIIKLTKSDSKIIYTEGRAADLYALSADISATTENLGWKPDYTLEEGLKRTIDWYRRVL